MTSTPAPRSHPNPPRPCPQPKNPRIIWRGYKCARVIYNIFVKNVGGRACFSCFPISAGFQLTLLPRVGWAQPLIPFCRLVPGISGSRQLLISLQGTDRSYPGGIQKTGPILGDCRRQAPLGDCMKYISSLEKKKPRKQQLRVCPIFRRQSTHISPKEAHRDELQWRCNTNRLCLRLELIIIAILKSDSSNQFCGRVKKYINIENIVYSYSY